LVLIAFLVYVVFRFLRGTRGARLVKGFALVVMLAAVLISILGGDLFGRMQFLLGKFLAFAAFGLAIIFQPELRRALMRIGEVNPFSRNPHAVGAVVDQVIRAVENLSKNKIGCIIAIEREVGLRGVVEVGAHLDAEVSADLLRTIFWPGSALHDMGVVISGERIVAAGVQFPLADGTDLAQELGSRHRAAIGLSQEADCLVIVVSEETGAISLAERGQLLRKLSVEGLRSMLLRGLGFDVQATSRSGDGTPPADPDEKKTRDKAA
jgi:diadenylate cyclase